MNQNDATLTGDKGTAQVVRESESASTSADDGAELFQAGRGEAWSSSRQDAVKPWQWCSCLLAASGGGELSSPRVSSYLSLEMQPVIAPFETLFLKQGVAVLFKLGSSSEQRSQILLSKQLQGILTNR